MGIFLGVSGMVIYFVKAKPKRPKPKPHWGEKHIPWPPHKTIFWIFSYGRKVNSRTLFSRFFNKKERDGKLGGPTNFAPKDFQNFLFFWFPKKFDWKKTPIGEFNKGRTGAKPFFGKKIIRMGTKLGLLNRFFDCGDYFVNPNNVFWGEKAWFWVVFYVFSRFLLLEKEGIGEKIFWPGKGWWLKKKKRGLICVFWGRTKKKEQRKVSKK